MEIPGLERPIHVEVAACSDVGRQRGENQDAFLLRAFRDGDDVAPSFVGQGASVNAEPGAFSLGARGAVLAVADGMGGAAEGALASRMALESFTEKLRGEWLARRVVTPQDFSEALHRSVDAANEQVYEASRVPEREGMGTTFTAVGLLGTYAHLVQVGDSRAYLWRGGALTQLTRDQSFVQELVDRGEMTREDAEKSEQRSVLLQALGVQPSVSADLTWQPLRRGDMVLICSDGLHGVVDDGAIARWLSDDPEPGRVVAGLVESANRLGGPDNVTVVVARVTGDGLPATGVGEEPRSV